MPDCATCGSLPAVAHGYSKNGRPEDDVSLPAAAGQLAVVRTVRGSRGSGRVVELWRCPTCGTYYRYATDYEFLAGGSEDEETLTRLDGPDSV